MLHRSQCIPWALPEEAPVSCLFPGHFIPGTENPVIPDKIAPAPVKPSCLILGRGASWAVQGKSEKRRRNVKRSWFGYSPSWVLEVRSADGGIL
jgi:hypothetical protein